MPTSEQNIEEKYIKLADLFKALANPVRLKILDILISKCNCSIKGPGCCVGEINSEIELPQPYISKHLKILNDCGILSYRRDANKIYYSFADSTILRELAQYVGKCCIK
jgi:DNA-binding transcriptional ArsR family regulator